MIPLASFADFVHESGRFTGDASMRAAQHRALDGSYAPVSPLSAPSRLDPRRVLVIAADADRITPMSHARRLASHFAAPIHVFPGGHLLQLGRSEGFQRVARMLADLGLVATDYSAATPTVNSAP